MKKLHVVIAALAIVLSLIYLLRHQAQRSHKRELQACTKELEQIRANAAKLSSVELYPFQEYRWTYDRVSNFEGGVATFSKTKGSRNQQGFVDFNNNILLEYCDPISVDGFGGFGGFEDGRTGIFVWEHDSVPWGFLLPYGNPVPRINGTIDCTGKVTLNTKWPSIPTF